MGSTLAFVLFSTFGLLATVPPPPKEAPVTFDTSPRRDRARAKLPKVIQPLVPKRGIYAAGGGLTSSSWRIGVNIDTNELIAGENPQVNSKSFEVMPRTYRVTLPRKVVIELVGLADKAWRHTSEPPDHPIADYDELLVVGDGEEVFKEQGYGPLQDGPAKTLLERLHALSPARTAPARVALYDVQGLHGGRNVFIEPTGRAVVVTVAPGMREARHELNLSSKELSELHVLLKKHHFFGIEIPKRLGVPDEAHPQIEVGLPDGQLRSVMKWANDQHADFDAIYGWLLALEKRAQSTRAIKRGAFDWHWRPRGF